MPGPPGAGSDLCLFAKSGLFEDACGSLLLVDAPRGVNATPIGALSFMLSVRVNLSANDSFCGGAGRGGPAVGAGGRGGGRAFFVGRMRSTVVLAAVLGLRGCQSRTPSYDRSVIVIWVP